VQEDEEVQNDTISIRFGWVVFFSAGVHTNRHTPIYIRKLSNLIITMSREYWRRNELNGVHGNKNETALNKRISYYGQIRVLFFVACVRCTHVQWYGYVVG
jgi:hypothetical protein